MNYKEYLTCQACRREDSEEEVEILGRKFMFCEECAIGANYKDENSDKINREFIERYETRTNK